jgi:hypothetical protein
MKPGKITGWRGLKQNKTDLAGLVLCGFRPLPISFNNYFIVLLFLKATCSLF